MQPRSYIHILMIVNECEAMSLHTPKWTPTLGVEVWMDFQIFREQFERLELIILNSSLYHWKLLKRKCLKWVCMIHLSVHNTSYDQKKVQESKCQFAF
jgi:hypothetical protein